MTVLNPFYDMIFELDKLEKLMPSYAEPLRFLSKVIRNKVWGVSDEKRLAKMLNVCNWLYSLLVEVAGEHIEIIEEYVNVLDRKSDKYTLTNLNKTYDNVRAHIAVCKTGDMVKEHWKQLNPYFRKEYARENLFKKDLIEILDDLFNKIVERNNIDMSNAKTPKSTLSRVLETNSQSTTYGVNNTFYSVYGVSERRGFWGLVDNDIPQGEPSYTQDDDSFAEGKEVLRKHVEHERNRKLIILAKQKFRDEHNGELFCEACGFNFEKEYGELGKDFVEVHHTKPVSEMQDGEKTNINDVVMVCSNCHSMIHRRRPWLTKEDIKTILHRKVAL